MFKRVITGIFFMAMGVAHAFAPQTGTWVVTSELNGKPGRGIALDVQNGIVVMQMYAYEQGGQPTFYLGVGQLNGDVQTNLALSRYTGGRYFGSGPLSGKEAGSPGAVYMRFTSGTTGFATFPGESEQAISRFNFGYPFAPEGLKGLWSLTTLSGSSVFTDVVALSVSAQASSSGNGLLVTADGSFGCEHQISGVSAGFVVCVKVGSSGQLLRGYAFKYSVNEGEGLYANASGKFQDAAVFVRRLTTPNGAGTGVLFKQEETAPDVTAVRQQISNFAAAAVPQ